MILGSKLLSSFSMSAIDFFSSTPSQQTDTEKQWQF